MRVHERDCGVHATAHPNAAIYTSQYCIYTEAGPILLFISPNVSCAAGKEAGERMLCFLPFTVLMKEVTTALTTTQVHEICSHFRNFSIDCPMVMPPCKALIMLSSIAFLS